MGTLWSRPGRRRLAPAAFAAVLALSAAGCESGKRPPKPPKPAELDVSAAAFPDLNDGEPYNVSGAVPLADSRFLLVDNNLNDALLELELTADGQQAGPLVRRPLTGLAEGEVDDIEDIALAEAGGRRFVFATTSLSVQPGSKKKGREDRVRPGGLLRIAIGADGALGAESMPQFRDWLVTHVPELLLASDNDPDRGGLNVEGLAWDPQRSALLLGIRTPVSSGKPMVVPVRIKDPAGPWAPANLEALPVIRLKVERAVGEQGIRGMATNAFGTGFLVTVGNSTSESRAPFSLYVWDGDADGTSRRLPVKFADKMKPEGVASGTVGGREAILVADDAGGFAVIWRDASGL
jgi:hypothetical protein